VWKLANRRRHCPEGSDNFECGPVHLRTVAQRRHDFLAASGGRHILFRPISVSARFHISGGSLLDKRRAVANFGTLPRWARHLISWPSLTALSTTHNHTPGREAGCRETKAKVQRNFSCQGSPVTQFPSFLIVLDILFWFRFSWV
jgi:hypothetical protein